MPRHFKVTMTAVALGLVVAAAAETRGQSTDLWRGPTSAWGAASAAARMIEQAWGADPRPTLDTVLDSVLPLLLDEFPTPGTAVLVLRDGRPAYRAGWGYADRETQTPITDPALLFNVASISKVLTAIGVMRLVERGDVDLDAPVERYLTRWRLPSSGFDHSGVTVRRVLSHTAGLSPGGWEGYAPDAPLPPLEDVLAGAAPKRESLRVMGRPGTSELYSNGGFGLLQLLVEEVSGRPFAEFMTDEVLLPLGMTFSAFSDPVKPEIVGRLATPHDWRLNPIFARRFTNLAAGGLLATLDDLGRLAVAEMYEPSSEHAGNPILSPASLRAMHTPVAPSRHFGLGHVIQAAGAVRVVGHTGLIIGWNASFQVVPETGDAIVVLTNGDNGYYVHHTLVYLWALWTTGERLGSGGVAPKKRVNRLVGVLERAAEAGEVRSDVAGRLVALLEEVDRAIAAGDRDTALAAVDRVSAAAANLASRTELSNVAAGGLRRHVQAIREWLRLP